VGDAVVGLAVTVWACANRANAVEKRMATIVA